MPQWRKKQRTSCAQSEIALRSIVQALSCLATLTSPPTPPPLQRACVPRLQSEQTRSHIHEAEMIPAR